MNISTATIEKLVYKGFGLAHNQEKIVFIPYSVPGDKLEFSIYEQKRSHDFGNIETIIKPSPHRIPAVCQAFEKCGGCNWLNIEYSFQLQAKTDIIREIYPDQSILPICPSPDTKSYRNKVFYPVALQNGKPIFGIYASQTHKVIQHETCELVPKMFDEIGKTIMDFLEKVNETPYNEQNHTGNIRHIGFRISQEQKIIVIIVTKKSRLSYTNSLIRSIIETHKSVTGIVQNVNNERGNTILSSNNKLLYGSLSFYEQILHLQFRLHYQSFCQVNLSIAEQLIEFICSQLEKTDIVLDAFCGIGIFALLIAKYVTRAVGIDSNKQAIEDAVHNTKLNHISNAVFWQGKVEDLFPEIVAKEQINTVLFDPPRKGLDPSVITSLSQMSIKKVIYISCDPITQKRDIKSLTESKYEIQKIQPFDMFPQTYHIENVIVLGLK